MAGFLLFTLGCALFVMLPWIFSTGWRAAHRGTTITDKAVIKMHKNLINCLTPEELMLRRKYGAEATNAFYARRQHEYLINTPPSLDWRAVERQNLSEVQARLIYGNKAVNHYLYYHQYHHPGYDSYWMH